MERYFQISFHALILTAFLAVVETGRLGLPSILIFLVIFGATATRNLRNQPALLGANGALFLSIGYILFFILDVLVFSGSLLTAVIHLVLFLELAKLAQIKHNRDYLYLILLAFLQILAASSMTIDMSFVATLFLFLIALVSTLMSFEIYRSAGRASNTGGVSLDATLGGMSVWATIWIVIIGVALFFSIPRFGTGHFTRGATQALLLSGFSESVELGEIGEVKLSSALIMRARVVDGSPARAPKWRGLALDTFDGRGWSKSNRTRQALKTSGTDRFNVEGPSGQGETVRFQIFLEPLATPALFGPHVIRSVTGNFRGLEQDDADSVYQRVRAGRRTQYEVLSQIPRKRPATDVADTIEESEPPSDVYLQVPPGLDPRIVDLAETITIRANTVAQKAALVETHLRTNYAYSLELAWEPGDQPLDTFLFESRSGHCEYFASSMAIMLRTLGIPTRMVNGFLPGEYNSIGDSYIVRQSDAHSWVEVYLPGQGWTEFDPTPPDPNQSEFSTLTLLSHYVDAAELSWNAYVLTYDSAVQFQLFRSAQDTVQSARDSLHTRVESWTTRTQDISAGLASGIRRIVDHPTFWLLIGGSILVGIGLRQRVWLRTAWKMWKLRRGRGAADGDLVAQLFYRAAGLAGRRARARLPHETWREWIIQLPDEGRSRLMSAALEIFEKARYGRSQISREDYTHMERTIHELKNA